MSETSNAVGGPEELKALLRERHEAEQVLAQALGHYPWYKDDPKNFPGATEADGVCTGPFTLIDVATEAADRIKAEPGPSGEVPDAAVKELRWAAQASRADVAVVQIGEWPIQLSVPDLLSILRAAERRRPPSRSWALGFARGLRDGCPGPESFWERGDEFAAGFDAARAIKGRLDA